MKEKEKVKAKEKEKEKEKHHKCHINYNIGYSSNFSWIITSDDNDANTTTLRFAGNGYANSENENVTITTSGYKFAYIDDKRAVSYISDIDTISKIIKFNSISSSSDSFIETVPTIKIVDDNGNDLGNGVQINITTSTSYNDSPNQIYGEDLYLDIQGATINTTIFTETEVSGEGGTEIEGQYRIEYDRQTDTDWITDFDGNNIDWYILIPDIVVDVGEGGI